ncbi:MAG: TonB-dependent receptor [bacterium]|nr:TonB-dependent receptor [bacterium]
MYKSTLLLLIFVFVYANPTFSQKKQKVDIFELSFEELANIKVISATKTEQTISEAPAIISIVTQQQIMERGYLTVGEALQSIAGMYLLHDRYQFNLGLRGINGGMRAWSRLIKLMIDGQAVAYRPSSENFLGHELIPVNAVDRIEIVRGPASALYGANAFLGVINIITKNSEESIWGELTTDVGYSEFLGSYGLSALYGGKKDNFDFIFAAGFNRSDQSGLIPLNVPGIEIFEPDIKSINDVSRNKSIFSRITYNSENLGKFTIDMNYQMLDSFAEFQDWGVLTHNNRININNYFIRGRYTRNFTENLTWNSMLAFNKGEPGDKDKLDIDDDLSDWITRDVGYQGFDVNTDIAYNFSANNSITAGFDYTNDDQNLQTHYVNVSDTERFPRQGIEYGNKTFINTGYYLQTIVYPVNSFGITAGLRFDDHNIYEDVINYKIAGVYQLSDKVFTKIMYGTSYKAPSPVQLFTNFIATEGVVGNPDLKPEKAKTVEAALILKPRNNLNFNVNVFYNTINDKVEMVLPIGSVSNIKSDNIAKINSAGFEFEILHNYNNIVSYGNFSYQKSIIEKDHLVRGTVKIKTDLYPSYMLKFGINYKLPEYSLNFNFEGRATSSLYSSEINSFIYDPVNYRLQRYELSSYFLADLTISLYNIKLFNNNESRIFLKIYNLFDEKYSYPGFNNFDIPGFERKFVLKFTYQF